ncbi:hypothetical protein BKA82DRAFT_2606638 [Pisolithus tinctorius]|nr:hypothetical protein BKA82DRAFT_2606638 [Pisolithus tinctorius]
MDPILMRRCPLVLLVPVQTGPTGTVRDSPTGFRRLIPRGCFDGAVNIQNESWQVGKSLLVILNQPFRGAH